MMIQFNRFLLQDVTKLKAKILVTSSNEVRHSIGGAV